MNALKSNSGKLGNIPQKDAFSFLTRPSQQVLWGGLVIFILSILTYLGSINGGFIWDDNDFIVGNGVIRNANLFWKIWFSKQISDYWPISYSFFWLAWRLFGMHCTAYHLVNICIHAATSILIWRILKKLYFRFGFLAALIFCVHPVNVEAVSWIFQIKTTLAMFFALSSFYYFVKHLDTGSIFFYGASIVLFILGVLSKTSVITWPCVLAGYLWWKGDLKWQSLLKTIPFFVIAAIVGMIGILWHSYDDYFTKEIAAAGTFAGRLALAGWSFWFYLLKAIIPTNLMFVNPRWSINPANIIHWLPSIALLLLFMLLVFYRKKSRPALAGSGYFFIVIFPVLGFVDIFFMRFSLVADHYQYGAIIGIIALIVESLGRYLAGRGKTLPWVLGVVVLLFFIGSVRQTRMYENEETVWKTTIKKNPSCFMAYDHLGTLYQERGSLQKALDYFKKALELKPNSSESLSHIAQVYYTMDNFEKASDFARRACIANPDDPFANYTMATVLLWQNKAQEALSYAQKSVNNQTRGSQFENTYATILLQLGQPDSAIAHYQQALVYCPVYGPAQFNLAQLLRNYNRIAEALPHFLAAYDLGYRSDKACFNCGAIYYNLKNFQSAIEYLTKSINLNPNNAEPFFLRALSFKELGNFTEACEDLQKSAQMGFKDAVTLYQKHCL